MKEGMLRACLAFALVSSVFSESCSQYGDKKSCKSLRKAGCKWKKGSCVGTVNMNLYCSKGYAKKERKSEAKAIRWCEDQEQKCQLDVTQPEITCVQRIAPSSIYTFRWATDPFVDCPNQCGTTEHHQQREVRCEAVMQGLIVFAYADSRQCPNHGRPDPQRLCPATDPCKNTYRWHAPAFRPCQSGCGVAESTQARTVSCQPNGVMVPGLQIPEEWCEHDDARPSEVQVCPATDPCYKAEWLVAPFKPCPMECGHNATRLTRDVRCVAGPTQRSRPDADCAHLPKPKGHRGCLATQECLTHRWVYDDFPECSTQCGQQRIMHRRDVSCYEFQNGRRAFRTDHHPCVDANQVRPVIEKTCPMTLPCISFSWESLKWSGCPWDTRDHATCGKPVREARDLRCRAHDATNDMALGVVPLGRCCGKRRPDETRDCAVVKCEPQVIHAHGGVVDLSTGGTPIIIMPDAPPVPVTDVCEDDPTWKHVSATGEQHGCAFYDSPIMQHFCTEYLPAFDLGADGRWPDEGCPKACGICSARQHGVYHKEVATSVDGHSQMCPVGGGNMSIRHGYDQLSECVDMCNGCNGCVGFVDYHEFEKWFCVFKSSDAARVQSDTHKDYYQKP